MLFVGDDWAEDHHDIELEDDAGKKLAKIRLPEGLEGVTRLHAVLAAHAPPEWTELSMPMKPPDRSSSASKPTAVRG